MNPRSVINFFKTPTGAFLLFCFVLAGLFFACKRFLPGATKPHPLIYSTKAAAVAASKQTMQTFQNTNYSPVANVAPATATAAPETASAPEAKKSPGHAPPKPEVLPISLFAEPPQAEQKPLGKDYAPYGRLIPCELIVTVDSSSIQTPIIGLVTEDIYHDGRLIIPAGTEVHGKAQTDRSRERIASSGSWTLVWQDGKELRLSGIALDREADPNGDGWSITDGSAGLRGQILKSDDMAEIKLFAATFLSGAASAFTQTQPTIYGNQITPTLQNAPLTGAQAVLQAYAQQILDSIQRDGFYVRVPAGKQFYIYVTQTIDESDAAIGGTRFAPDEFAETNQPAAPSAQNYFPPNAAMYPNRAMP
ncbi:MAG TPA: TrbI/VirB10 family protein [Candidatus Paceibacterota bacterium]|nr:TrbI/VirB10 family protein [Candidatus Paceibacterota bacterium]